ncbi:MAG: hypothetical protein DMF49_02125 [Acidobacteria bacterium]|nr:MAG: hypothetical protein DMF49_02125 [Acidobacteriota bacterium]
MPIDREKILRAADKLVRQDRLLPAVAQYSLLIKDNPHDLVTINKVGDLLARAGRPAEAMRHFQKIAEVYTQGGFFLKAIAIYKKILKLDPKLADANLRLADLYARQDLVNEAREMYLKAARQFLERNDVTRSRETYEKLLRLEPDRVETHVAFGEMLEGAGDHARAAAELAAAAGLLASRGRSQESMSLYRRALGSAAADQAAAAAVFRRVLQASGARVAISLAEELHRQHPDWSEILDVLIEAHLALGQHSEAERVAKEAYSGVETPGPMTLLVLARLHARQGRPDEAVEAASQGSDELVARERATEAAAMLDDILSMLPENTSLLERRVEIGRTAGERAGTIGALRKLIETYSAAGMRKEAARALEQLAVFAPEKAPPRVASTAPGPGPSPGPAAPARAKKTGALTADEEFIAEHLAEADVFSRYGMQEQAIEQLQAILERSPSSLEALRRLKVLYLDSDRPARAVEQCLKMAETLAAGGREEQASAELQEALQIDPGNARATSMLSALEEASSAGPELLHEQETGVPFDEDQARVRSDEEDLLDLSGELAESLARALGETAPAQPEEPTQSFGEVIQAFRQKVDEEVGEEDYGTHYELGIAFKEMGLLDEAISELERASRSAERFLDCCGMIALCQRDKGDSKSAEHWYRRALNEPVTPQTAERRIGLIYDLGELLADQGDWLSAREAFEQVFRGNQNYRDVRERLREARERSD